MIRDERKGSREALPHTSSAPTASFQHRKEGLTVDFVTRPRHLHIFCAFTFPHLPSSRRGDLMDRRSSKPAITAVPVTYRGTRFRSTLEADWAATFDSMGWYWQYEPAAVKLLNGDYYRPDFCLPGQRVWCEVKGPHDERLEKAVLLQETLSYDAYDWESWLVVVLRPPGPGESAVWHGTSDQQDIVLVRCWECEHYCFLDYDGIRACRHHIGVGKTPNAPWKNGGELLRSDGDAKFTRVSPPRQRGA